jgi:hypothetical protein
MKKEVQMMESSTLLFLFLVTFVIKKVKKQLIVPTKKGLNGGQNVNKDEANCASGYVDIALICNEELDSALISMEDEKDKAKF